MFGTMFARRRRLEELFVGDNLLKTGQCGKTIYRGTAKWLSWSSRRVVTNTSRMEDAEIIVDLRVETSEWTLVGAQSQNQNWWLKTSSSARKIHQIARCFQLRYMGQEELHAHGEKLRKLDAEPKEQELTGLDVSIFRWWLQTSTWWGSEDIPTIFFFPKKWYLFFRDLPSCASQCAENKTHFKHVFSSSENKNF